MFPLPTDPDLGASVEMLAFMWVAAGNDPTAVTPHALGAVRMLLAQHFVQLPPQLQALFANGRASLTNVQAAWNAAAPVEQAALAQQFQQILGALGLVPAPAGYGEVAGGGQSLNADIAANIAWKASGAGNWGSR